MWGTQVGSRRRARLVATAVCSAMLAIFGIVAVDDAPVLAASYVNPLSALSGLRAARIDQGVDYYSSGGNILAVGDGRVKYAARSGSGWNPGGAFIEYQLTDGPGSGLWVYVAECINLIVTGGTVRAGQAIASMNTKCSISGSGCSTFCIETGWGCSTKGVLDSAEAGQYCTNQDQGNYTVATGYGCNFNNMLKSLRAPSGTGNCATALNKPPVPSTWPRWTCMVTAWTDMGTTDIQFLSGATVSHAYFDAYWGICVYNSTNYIQFASETSYSPLQITTPTEIEADLRLYNCNVAPCTTVFEGYAYEGTGTYKTLYEDSNAYLSNSSEWCMYFSYKTANCFISSLIYTPHTVASGSVENCVQFG